MKFGNIIKASKSSRMYMNEKGKTSKKNSGSGASRDPNTTKVKSAIPAKSSGPAGQFESSTVDLEVIEKAYSTEAYIRRAVDKVSGLMFKSGWELTSKNQDALEYVETRLKLIEESTGKSFEELLRELGQNFVLYSNAPIVKTRGSDNLGGLNATGYYGGEPISGLFPAPPTEFQILTDEFGNIEGYKVESASGGDGLELNIEDVAHLTYHKPTGRAFGVPYIQNVLDDVLILRQIEENVARLIYKNLFPLQVYTVGVTKEGYEATDEEIEEVSTEIEGMPLDGMIVVPERHKIETVSSNSAMMDASAYLKYFRQRVFTGLNMSESTMGIGDTANRSTSDNQSSDLNDLVKDFQQSYSEAIQREIINEILFEGGFDPTLNREDEVMFSFVEIETSEKIKRDNHIIQLWLNNLISFEEARIALGRDPEVTVEDLYANMFQSSKTPSADDAQESKQVDNQNQPENQNGKADGPKKENKQKINLSESSKNKNMDLENKIFQMQKDFKKEINVLRQDIKSRVENNQSPEDIFPFTTKLVENRIQKKIDSISLDLIKTVNKESMKVKNHILDENKYKSKSLMREIELKLSESSYTVDEVFESMDYKIDSLIKTEYYRGYNFEKCLQKITDGNKEAMVVTASELYEDKEPCTDCKNYVINLNDKTWYRDVPPHHFNCECEII